MSIAVVVNSCLSYYQTTVPLLLQSLSDAGWDTMCHTFIVVGEASEDLNDTYQGTPIFFRRYVNIDNNGLVWAASPMGIDTLRDFEWIFYLHDTCTVFPDFKKRLLSKVPSSTEYVGMKICTSWSMSIGFYHKATLQSQPMVEYFSATINMSLDPVSMKGLVEDVVFDELGKYGTLGILNTRFSKCTDVRPLYGEAKRRTEVFDWPGINKHKANWGQGGWIIVP